MTARIRADGSVTDTGLADVFELPAGYRCAGGFLVTYDLSVDTLCREVLAPLAGLDTGPLEVLLDEAPALTVVCQQSWPGPMLPEQVSIIEWPGGGDRPLHVKAGLLRFEPIHGVDKALVRAYIGSTNLTSGGFGRNRELLAWTEDAMSDPWAGKLRAAVSSICRQVAAAAAGVAAGSEPSPPLQTTLDEVLKGFGEPGKLPSSVRHTIGDPPTAGRDSTSSRLLADVPHPAGFDRLEVISPPYWKPYTGGKVAKALRDVLPRTGSVRLLTAMSVSAVADGPLPVAFPESLVTALEDEHGLRVEVGVLGDGHESARRPLHAKAYVLHGSTRSTVVLGSANATESGLSGRNREAVVLFDLPRAQAEALVEAAGPWRTDVVLGEQALGSREDRPDRPQTLAGVSATFTPVVDAAAGRAGRYRGQLVLSGLAAGMTLRVRHAGKWVQVVADDAGCVDLAAACGVAELERRLEEGSIDVEVDGRVWSVLVSLTPAEGWLQAQIERLDTPPAARQLRHRFERLLLADLRLLQRTRRAGRPGQLSQGYTAAGDDRLTLPIDQRLQTILRYRHAAAGRHIPDELIVSYLEAEDRSDPRVQVALAALHDELDPADTDELMVALHRALRAAPTPEGGS